MTDEDGRPLRLQVFLARRTGLSRRAAERRIREGVVHVNGEVATIGSKVVPGEDRVELEGYLVEPERPQLIWLMLHKPRGVVTTRSDERGRKTVMDLLDEEFLSLFPVGRLDSATSGLLLLTNDGETSNWLLHPSRHVEKTYNVTVENELGAEQIRALQDGSLILDGSPVAPALLTQLDVYRYALTLREGRNRQVRRMFELIGEPVFQLHRNRFGPLKLGDLPRGRFRFLYPNEVCSLKNITETA